MAWLMQIATTESGRVVFSTRLDGDPHTDACGESRFVTPEEAIANQERQGRRVERLDPPRPECWGGPMIPGPGPVVVHAQVTWPSEGEGL